ncbi:outer membrane beta-barrel protein [Segatella baroniae]|uniref:outer membrane beta-barrel protein n=1 Tax=Segatella baroniae TaxID=305719 RepID=UPI003570E1F2
MSYRLNRHWSLQTGLNYSYLSSTTTYSGGAEGNRTEQSLHYVGLPLSAAYTLAQGRHYRSMPRRACRSRSW